MAINVRPDIKQRVDELVRSGEFEDASDVVSLGIKLIQEQKKLDHLREVIGGAEDRVAQGEGIKMSPTFFEDVKAEARTRSAKGVPINPDVVPNR